jgi:hypothetical protein
MNCRCGREAHSDETWGRDIRCGQCNAPLCESHYAVVAFKSDSDLRPVCQPSCLAKLEALAFRRDDNPMAWKYPTKKGAA